MRLNILRNLHMKDSDKKCNGKKPHSSSGEGRAPRGPSRPPLSAVQTMGTFTKQYRNKKREAEVSLQLSNFVLWKISINT